MARAAKFKQRCVMCKQNMVLMYSRRQFPICVECHMKKIDKPVKDAKYKKLLDIPREFYLENLFLRNIKESYLRFDKLSEKQIEAFERTVKEMKEGPKDDEE
ncbi:TPA: hypothetical protein HA278_06610 [Candidatus Woesearchaeota archaeon]|nr:hypothetical protein [archaeon]HIJ11704.1 hypothetical protein [Candidatus Woesearchaeota archaeon]